MDIFQQGAELQAKRTIRHMDRQKLDKGMTLQVNNSYKTR